MKLSAPIHELKSEAKRLKRTGAMPMVAALNHIAQREGFASWSLLQARASKRPSTTSDELFDQLTPGDMVLLAARPLRGKTTVALQLLLQAEKAGHGSYFFSLEYTAEAFAQKMASIDPAFDIGRMGLSLSDDISAEHIMAEVTPVVRPGMVIGVDYLQLLDQKRENTPLQAQIEALSQFAAGAQCIIAFICQIDRTFEGEERRIPTIEDIRLPNPLDLSLFNRIFFVDGDRVFG
jgi:replicative DNA helicase